MTSVQIRTKIPGPKSDSLMQRRKAAVARGPFHTTPIFVAKAKGAILEDVDGNRFIDFAAGIGVVNVGHTAENVVKAVQLQAAELTHGSFNVTAYEGYIRLCEKLNKAVPGDFEKKTFLANSGAEAVENAIKIARAYTNRQGVICFDHAFHGRTYLAMTLTSKAKPYRYGFGPYNPEIYRAAFPYVYRWPGNKTTAEVSAECFKQFEDLVNSRVSPTQTAAVIVEPVLGEGGFLPMPREFAQSLRKYCTDNKIVLILDEIQSGFGRTGTLFASEQLGIAPDLITIAKGIGGGLPISAVTGRAEIMDAPIEGGIGGTFGGNPIACAAALAVFDTMENGSFLSHAKNVGDVLKERLLVWQKKFNCIGDVHGMGPMQAIEFVKDRATKEPDADLPKKILKTALENGLILMTAGSYSNAIRFLMPLSIQMAELEEGLGILERALKEHVK